MRILIISKECDSIDLGRRLVEEGNAVKYYCDTPGYERVGLGFGLAGWFLRKNDPVVFLFLTFWYDPFITAAYLRKGKFNGMTSRDWLIFYGSLVLCNGYWTLACFMGISLVEWAWQGLKGLGYFFS